MSGALRGLSWEGASHNSAMCRSAKPDKPPSDQCTSTACTLTGPGTFAAGLTCLSKFADDDNVESKHDVRFFFQQSPTVPGLYPRTSHFSGLGSSRYDMATVDDKFDASIGSVARRPTRAGELTKTITTWSRPNPLNFGVVMVLPESEEKSGLCMRSSA